MKIHHAVAAVLLVGPATFLSALPVAAQQPSAQEASCDTLKRLTVVQESSRKLLAESAALGKSSNASLPQSWTDKLQSEARIVNASAEKLASAPASADPEAAFNLGKHMNSLQQLLGDASITSARTSNPALGGVTRLSDALQKDVGFVLMHVAKLKDEARRCAAPSRS